MSTARIRELHEQQRRLSAELVGIESGVLLFLEEHGAAFPRDLVEALGMSIQSANNRLRALERAGLATREQVNLEGGGRAFRYRPVNPPDHVRGGETDT